MIKQILCDLDGTLIHFDHPLFVKRYVGLLSQKLAAYVDPAEFSGHLLAATGAMIKSSDGSKTNADKFWEYMKSKTNYPFAQLEPLIDEFYQNDFHQLKRMIALPKMKPVLDKFAVLRLPVALATNPVFPKAAVHARLSWGGYKKEQFNLVTTYETSHFCKPNPAYYQEITGSLGVEPHECLMIGNDVAEDLPAGQIGVKTYLLTDALINSQNLAVKADYIGTAEDLLRDLDLILK